MSFVYAFLIMLVQIFLFLSFVFWYEKRAYLPPRRIFLLIILAAVFYFNNLMIFD